MKPRTLLQLLVVARAPYSGLTHSADWQSVAWREPQVRQLPAEMTRNGGKTDLYRKYATEERDPDSIEAIRLWDAGGRVVNTNDFEHRCVTNKFGKDGRVMRVVLRGTDRTILGTEVLLTSDPGFNQGIIRLALAEMSMGRPRDYYAKLSEVGDIREALRRWDAGVRLINTNWFTFAGPVSTPELVYRGTLLPVDPTHIRLSSDVPWSEANVRYFMADIALGGSIEFFRAAAERDHEMGCLEAVRRTEEGSKITNLDQFERKKLDGKVLVTRKDSQQRIKGSEVKLSSDLP